MRTNRKWIVSLASLVAVGAFAVFVLWRSPTTSNASVSVTFLAASNGASGAKYMLFCATNVTRRLFVRGNSAIEWQGAPSNQITVVQITNVDYLKPGQSAFFSVRSPALGQPWRLDFTYMGQFGRLESFRYEAGWALHRHGFPIDPNKLPRHDIRQISTQWIND